MENFKEFMARRHICSTPGCRNRETVRFSKSEGARTALFLCRDCIGEAFAAALQVSTEGCRSLEDVAVAVSLSISDRGMLKEVVTDGK